MVLWICVPVLILISYCLKKALGNINQALTHDCEFENARALNKHLSSGGRLFYYNAELKSTLTFTANLYNPLKVMGFNSPGEKEQYPVEYDLKNLTSKETTVYQKGI